MLNRAIHTKNHSVCEWVTTRCHVLLSLKMSLMVVSVAGAVVMRDPLTRMQPCAAAHYCSAAAIFGPRARLDSPAQFVAVEWQGRLGNNIGQYVVAR